MACVNPNNKRFQELSSKLENPFLAELIFDIELERKSPITDEEIEKFLEDEKIRLETKGDVVSEPNPVIPLYSLSNNITNTVATSEQVVDFTPQTDLTEEQKRKLQREVDSKMKAFLERTGIELKNVDKITDSFGNEIDAIAKADIYKQTVEVIEGKKELNTLPEEAAHIYTASIRNTPLYNLMMEKITKFDTYDQVAKDYNDVYKGDVTKIKEEAIAHLIRDNIIKNVKNERPSNQNLFNRWWSKVWQWLKSKLGILNSKDLGIFVDAANSILRRNKDYVTEQLFTEITPEDYFYQLSSKEVTDRDQLAKSLDANIVTRDFESGGFKTIDGKKIKTTVENFVKNWYKKVFNNINLKAKKENSVKALAGMYIHKLQSNLMSAYNSGKTYDQIISEQNTANIYTRQTLGQLYNSDKDFKTLIDKQRQKDKGLFSLNQVQFNELAKGTEEVYNQIQNNNNIINKALGINEEAKIHTEFSMFSEKDDMAGVVDVLVMYPNGTVGLYNYESYEFVTEGREIIRDFSQIKKEAFDIEMSQYKRILAEQYGIKNFAESRVVPINVQFKYDKATKKDSFESFRDVQMGGKEREFLQQIPTARELTGDKDLDNSLKKMFDQRDNLRAKLKQDKSNKKLREQLNKLDLAIKKLQLDKDVNYIINEINSLDKEFNKRESIPKDKDGYLNLYSLNEFADYIDVFENFATNADKLVSTIGDEKQNLALSILPKTLQDLRKKVNNKIAERLLDEIDFNIDDIHKETNFLGRLFNQLGDFEQPAFKALYKLVTQVSENTRRDINKLIENMTGKSKSLQEWANKNGMSLFDAYNKIINPNTKNLISQYKSDYYNDFKKARKNKDSKWIKENTYFDEELYNKHRDAYFKVLDETYGAEHLHKTRDNLKKKWNKDFSPKNMFNPRNFYYRLKENAKYHTSDWTFMNKKGNEPLLNYYNSYVSYNEQFAELTGKEINKNYVANIRQDTIDRLGQLGRVGIGYLWRNLSHSLEVRDMDVGSREIDPITGAPRPTIPLFYRQALREPISPKELKDIEESLVKEGFEKGSTQYKIELDSRVTAKEFEKGNEFKSTDLTRSLILFGESAYSNFHLTQVEDVARGLKKMLESNLITSEVTDPKGKKLINKLKGITLQRQGVPSKDIEAFDKFLNLYFYGLTTQNKDIEYGKKNVYDEEGNLVSEGPSKSLNKTIQKVMTYTSVKALALDPILATANAIGIFTNSYITGRGGLYFTEDQFDKAQKIALQNGDKYKAAVGYFEPSARNLTYEKANNSSASTLSKRITLDNAFILHKKPDDFIDNTILVSMMQNYGIDPLDKKIRKLSKASEGTKSLWDTSEVKNGKLDIKGFEDNENSSKEYTKFRRMVQTVGTRIKGSIPQENKNLIGTTIWGQSLMQYRNWMPGLAKTRFGKVKYDEDFETIDVGRFRVIVGEFVRSKTLKTLIQNVLNLSGEVLLSAPIIGRFTRNQSIYFKNQNKRAAKIYYNQFIADNPDLRDKVTFKDFVDLRTAKLREFARELSMYLSFLGLAAFAKALIPDEDEKYIREFFARNAYKATNRGLLELSFWFSPESVTDILKSPIPSLRVLTDIQRWILNTFDVTRDLFLDEDDPNRAIFSKGAKDKTAAFNRTAGLIPFINQVIDLLNLFDKPVN